MPYAVQANLSSVLSDNQLAQLTAESGAADSAVVLKVLTDASSEIDGYLAGRYVVPVTGDSTTLEVLKVHCLKIAKWVFMTRRLLGGEYEELKKDYVLTIEFLKGLRDGKGSLSGASEVSAAATVDDSPANYGGLPSVFDNGTTSDTYYGL